MIADSTPSTYASFIERKRHLAGRAGFTPVFMPDFLFPFQRSLVEWSTLQGRSATFADCGLGKSIMELVWAENIVRRTNRPVLLLAPLSVSHQFIREAEKFGIECTRSADGSVGRSARVIVTNYERLHHFDCNDFAGVVCDESSILKSFDGRRRSDVTNFMRRMQYRLLATATAAPNDHVELGTSSEALGDLGHMDMLARFFKNDTKTIHIHGSKIGDFTAARWRFKPHAQDHFWRWVCSWARACRRPSDLGFDDAGFVLPPLRTREVVVKAASTAAHLLFEMPAETLQEQREEQRRTITERCEAAAACLTGDRPGVGWCQLNAEGDLLEKLIPGAVQVSGSDSDERKEEAFAGFERGDVRVIVTKPSIGGFGLNWQHCSRMTFFPSHSFEQFYQAVRRCWRFGQKKQVEVNVVTTEGGAGVLDNLNRKARQADEMFQHMVALMNDPKYIGASQYGHEQEEIPAWL